MDRINLKVQIRRNHDGLVSTSIWDDFAYSRFWWEDGNAACDCNRELFFARGLGQEEPEEIECSEGRFSVRLSDADSKDVLYDEWEARRSVYEAL